MYTLQFLILSAAAVSANTLPDQVGRKEWKLLNNTVEGRLQTGTPFSLPCFSSYQGSEQNLSSECTAIQTGYGNPTFRVEHFGAYMFPQWEACSTNITDQCLLDTANVDDPSAYMPSVDCKQGSVSPYYIDVKAPDDAAIGFRFAKETGVRLVIKNSGHDYKGRSSSKGSLALWAHNLKSIKHDPEFVPEGSPNGQAHQSTITIGAGVGFQEAYIYADEHNFTMIGGYHQTIAPSGGWVQGGGHSILSPVYGLGVDRVVQFKVVTPDGVYRVANEFSNPDLFWALRGGGGGTFGFVMESTHRVEKRLRLSVVSMKFNSTASNAAPWIKLIVDNNIKWAKEGWGGHMSVDSIINVNPLLSLEEAKESLKPVTDFAISQGGVAVVEELPSWYSFFTKYVVNAEAAVGPETVLGSRLILNSNFDTDAKREELQTAILKMAEYGTNPYMVFAAPYLYNYAEGSTSITPAWRNSTWEMGMQYHWTWNSTLEYKEEVLRNVSIVTQLFRDITPGSGAYTNEGDIHEPDHEESFWGENYATLLQLKHKYDPNGLLDCWQCVGWSGAADPRFACYPKNT